MSTTRKTLPAALADFDDPPKHAVPTPKRKRDRTRARKHIPVATTTDSPTGHAESAAQVARPVPPYVERNASNQGAAVITDTGREFIRLRASEGASQNLIAAEMGLSKSTLKQCFERDERNRIAWEHGAALLENDLVQSLVASARKGSFVPAMFLLKSRFGYVEGQPPTDNRPNVIIHLPDAYSPDEYMRSIRVIEQPARPKVTRPVVRALPSGNRQEDQS